MTLGTSGSKTSQMAAALALACAFAVPAVAQVGIRIGRTPPPLRYEVPPLTAGAGYLWNEGYWNWANNQYLWVPGRWVRPPDAARTGSIRTSTTTIVAGSSMRVTGIMRIMASTTTGVAERSGRPRLETGVDRCPSEAG